MDFLNVMVSIFMTLAFNILHQQIFQILDNNIKDGNLFTIHIHNVWCMLSKHVDYDALTTHTIQVLICSIVA